MIYTFITNKDIDVSIKQYFLDQIIGTSAHVLKKAEAAAFTLIKSKLNGRYDLVKLFPNIKEWASGILYNATNPYCSKNDVIYKALVPNTNASPDTHSTQWEESDPRDALLLLHCSNMTVYYVCERINPRKISDDIAEAYNRAIDWLDDVKNGKENPDFPLIAIGATDVRSGSNDRIEHYW